MPDLTPDVNCRYGAPMGRRTYRGDPDTAGKFYLRHIPLNSGGYDPGGAYWGLGQRLYGYASEDGEIEGFLRADSREAAKIEIREDYPAARFWR